MHRCLSIVFFVALVGPALLLAPSETAATGERFEPPADLRTGWYARIETTEGRILARLLPDQAPQAVAHFAALASGKLAWADPATGETHQEPYYDGVPVHRAEAGVRFEAGDRTGTGNGAPMMWLERRNEAEPINFATAGRLGMTRASGGRVSAVVFFITAAADPRLVRLFPCFGEVVEGLDVVFRISSVKTYSSGRPIDPPRIERIRVFPVGDPEPLPEPVPYHPKPKKLEPRWGKNGDARSSVP